MKTNYKFINGVVEKDTMTEIKEELEFAKLLTSNINKHIRTSKEISQKYEIRRLKKQNKILIEKLKKEAIRRGVKITRTNKKEHPKFNKNDRIYFKYNKI